MAPGHAPALLKLADREFRRLTDKPATVQPDRKFKPIKLNLDRLEAGWERKRGAAMRLTAVVLRDDDTALKGRVCGDERSRKTYSQAAEWLQREAALMRRMAKLMDTAGERLTAVLPRRESRSEG